MHNSVNSTRNTSLYGFQPSSVDFACKTVSIGPDLQVSMGHRPHLLFCSCKPELLASQLLVSMGPNPHLWFLHANQRILDQNHKSIWVTYLTCRCVHAKQRDLHRFDKSTWVPALICGLCLQNNDFRTRHTSLYGSQTSSVVLSTHNRLLSTRIKRLYWFLPSTVVL